MTYDRRGHGGSERVPGQGTRVEDEADLAGLIEELGLAPAHVAGNSFDASIVLGLATGRPDLFRSVIVHEPPLSAVIAGDREVQPLLDEVQRNIDMVLTRLDSGDIEGGSRVFVDRVAFGPGAWDTLPAPVRHTFIDNALTWMDEQRDTHWAEIDVGSLSRLPCPVLFTGGDQSFSWFRPIIGRLRSAVPHARVHTFTGAGHGPHYTHPDEYLSVISEFTRATDQTSTTTTGRIGSIRGRTGRTRLIPLPPNPTAPPEGPGTRPAERPT